MAGPYYVDPAAAGDATGASWTHAWVTLQTALDAAAAGTIIYCRGTQTLDATIDVDTRAGTLAAGVIKVIGCNATGDVDGTRFTLNANDGAFPCITATETSDLYWWENIRFTNTGVGAYHGISCPSGDARGWIFINCCADNCGGTGFNGTNFSYPIFYRCVAYSNTASGFMAAGFGLYLFCCAKENSVDGFDVNSAARAILIGCVAHANTEEGFGSVGAGTALINCVSDGNTDDGIEIQGYTGLYIPLILGCRVTNHSGAGDNGLYLASKPCFVGYSYFEDNTDNINDHTSVLFYPIAVEGGTTSSNQEDGADTDEGYVDRTNHDFSIRPLLEELSRYCLPTYFDI